MLNISLLTGTGLYSGQSEKSWYDIECKETLKQNMEQNMNDAEKMRKNCVGREKNKII